MSQAGTFNATGSSVETRLQQDTLDSYKDRLAVLKDSPSNSTVSKQVKIAQLSKKTTDLKSKLLATGCFATDKDYFPFQALEREMDPYMHRAEGSSNGRQLAERSNGER